MNKLSCGAVRGVKFFEFFRLVHGDVQHGVQRMGACAAGIVTAGGGESRRGRRNGMEQTQILTPRIGSEEIRRAAQILKKYRAGEDSARAAHHRQRAVLEAAPLAADGEGTGRGRQSRTIPQPTSGWLVNCILSKHADAMDCYPEPTVLPARAGRPRGGSEADADSAGDSEEEPVQADVLVRRGGTSSSPGARCTACSGTLGSSAGWGTSPSGGWIC